MKRNLKRSDLGVRQGQTLDVSIIIVSYNTRELLKKCLRSVEGELDGKGISGEVIVVDNGSKDGTREFLQRDCHTPIKSELALMVILNEDNVGFARANNQGAKRASGRYLLFLNPDTVVRPNVFSEMVEFLDQHPEAGIASCQLRNPDRSIQPQGGFLPRLSTVAVWAFFLDDVPVLHEILPSYQTRRKSLFIGRPKAVGWVAGTAMWARRDAWKKIGGFDEHLFLYGEDVELCYRAQKMGWKVVLNPKASIVHKGQGSSKEARWVTGEIEGLLYLFKKQKPLWEIPILKLILAIAMALRWFIFGILGSNENLRRAYAKAFRVARS